MFPSKQTTLVFAFLVLHSSFAKCAPAEVSWRDLDAATFAKARDEKKLVFLDLEAVWCHWCHVMDAKTYTNPQVCEALAGGFVCAKVDQDSRPDLARRYEDFGWPALVVIDPVTLRDLAIGSGYHRPEEFLKLLEKAKNPEARPSTPKVFEVSGDGSLSSGQRAVLLAKLGDRYDAENKGWGSGHKFVPWDNIEACIQLGLAGDDRARTMARETLSAGEALIDPEWGGLYQYSTGGNWHEPHFEKIMEFEAEVTRAYSLAYTAWGRPADLASARQIAKHLLSFLRSPDGTFYVSQDADVVQGQHSQDYFSLDDAGRRKIGVPRVDPHVYSHENGLAICALVTLGQASGEPEYLEDAKRAASWIIEHRALAGGGFSHDAVDSHGPFLADQVEMGRALLALHIATADSKWLDRSVACADFTDANFKQNGGSGYLASVSHPDSPAPVAEQHENVAVVRWCNLLARVTHEDRFAKMAERGMRFLTTPEIQDGIYSFVGGVLLADHESGSEPVHITIVGEKNDPAAMELFLAARKHPSPYKWIEWKVPGSKAKPGGIEYPDMGKAAAFLCAEGRCSAPKFTAEELVAAISPK